MDMTGPRTIPVSSIAEQLLFTTVRIETEDAKGEQSVGTAFAFSFEKDGEQHEFLVTARHVVEELPKGTLSFVHGRNDEPALEGVSTLNFIDFGADWCFHPNDRTDVAIMPLAPLLRHLQESGLSFFLRHLQVANIPTAAQQQDIDAIEEILFVGYPKGLWDSMNHLPLVRRGITASPFVVDFEGQKMFLIDAPVYAGSSGSPVVLWNPGGYPMKSGGWVLGSRFFLLGMLVKGLHAYETSVLEVDAETSFTLHSKPMIGLGQVLRAETIVEAIEHCLRSRESKTRSKPTT